MGADWRVLGILEILCEGAYQSGLLISTWLEAPPSTAPLPMVNCCHCQSIGHSSSHARTPGIKCWGGKVEMKFPLTHSCSLQDDWREGPALCEQLPSNPNFSNFIPWDLPLAGPSTASSATQRYRNHANKWPAHIALACTSLQNGVGSVKHHFPSVSLRWFLLTTFLSFKNLEIISRISWGEAGWPVVCHIFLRTGVTPAFFRSWGTAPGCHDSCHTKVEGSNEPALDVMVSSFLTSSLVFPQPNYTKNQGCWDLTEFWPLILRIFLPYVLLSLESGDWCDMPLQALLGQGLQLIRAWVCL